MGDEKGKGKDISEEAAEAKKKADAEKQKVADAEAKKQFEAKERADAEMEKAGVPKVGSVVASNIPEGASVQQFPLENGGWVACFCYPNGDRKTVEGKKVELVDVQLEKKDRLTGEIHKRVIRRARVEK